jgi:hypothetical protein
MEVRLGMPERGHDFAGDCTARVPLPHIQIRHEFRIVTCVSGSASHRFSRNNAAIF